MGKEYSVEVMPLHGASFCNRFVKSWGRAADTLVEFKTTSSSSKLCLHCSGESGANSFLKILAYISSENNLETIPCGTQVEAPWCQDTEMLGKQIRNRRLKDRQKEDSEDSLPVPGNRLRIIKESFESNWMCVELGTWGSKTRSKIFHDVSIMRK